jgi:hypothetical protein
MAIPLPYQFQSLDISGLPNATDSNNDVIGKVVPASYLDSNFSQLADIITVGNSAPQASYVGKMWLDKSQSPAVYKIWDGSAWVNAGYVTGADKVDGYHASQTVMANTIPVSKGDGKLDDSWNVQSIATTASPTFAGLNIDNGTLYVDKTNHRVGVGSSTLAHKFVVVGNENNTVLGNNIQAVMRLININTSTFGYKSELQFAIANDQLGLLAVVASEYTHFDSTNGVGGKLILGTKKASDANITQRMVIDSYGWVGIKGGGTMSAKLDVVHDTSDLGLVNDPTTRIARFIGVGNNTNAAVVEIRRFDTENKDVILRFVNAAYNYYWDFRLEAGGNNFKLINSFNNVLLYANSSTMYCGFGTIAPSAKIHIVGTSGYDQLVLQNSYVPTGTSDTNGVVGSIAWSSSYLYVKTASGWKRVSLSTF